MNLTDLEHSIAYKRNYFTIKNIFIGLISLLLIAAVGSYAIYYRENVFGINKSVCIGTSVNTYKLGEDESSLPSKISQSNEPKLKFENYLKKFDSLTKFIEDATDILALMELEYEEEGELIFRVLDKGVELENLVKEMQQIGLEFDAIKLEEMRKFIVILSNQNPNESEPKKES